MSNLKYLKFRILIFLKIQNNFQQSAGQRSSVFMVCRTPQSNALHYLKCVKLNLPFWKKLICVANQTFFFSEFKSYTNTEKTLQTTHKDLWLELKLKHLSFSCDISQHLYLCAWSGASLAGRLTHATPVIQERKIFNNSQTSMHHKPLKEIFPLIMWTI